MPNHIHSIVEIVGANNYSPTDEKDILGLWANDNLPLHRTSKTIGSMVRGFKIGATKYIRD